jgi:hypothetical protein
MNKKFLSAVLFGALLASTTGTFTSCKDYDDDINGLSERVDAIEKTLADLNTKFGSLAYVKSVSFAGGELVVTDQDGKPERFSIPDKNTTYSLEINQSTEGDATTVTVILKDGDGKVVSSKSFTLTDKDTITDTLDPSLFWMDESGVIWYGLKTDKDNCIKTGVTVPLHDKTSVAIVETKVGEAGPVVGWDITIDNVTTHLSVLDALSITSFSWIPKDYYNGIEAVAFGSYSYNKVVGTETADTTYTATGDETLSSFPGEANFYINPSSASLAQIKGGAEGATVLYKGATNHTTRADIGATATLSKTDGILTASIVGDMNQAETDPNALDMLALRMTTTNGQTFTTNYFAVYNQKEEVSFTLVDNCKLEGEAIKDADKLSTQWSNVKEQAAVIDANNVAESGNAHLVQALQYNEAIAGVDLNKYVAVAMTKGDKSEIVNLAAKKLSIEYVLCKYDVEGTDQINYATLEGSTLKAVNYEGVNMSCIGKTPIVKAIVKDTNNGNAVVAVAYIKFLYVGNEWTVSKNYTAPVSETKVLDWDCFEDPAMNYTTTVKYMSTEVYPKVGSELGLNALSKKEFATIYQFVADQADVPTEFKSTNITSITEITGAENNADNRQVKFDIDEDAIKEVNKDGTYTFYGVYKKTDAAAAASSSQYRQYPVYVAIPYVVKVQNYPTLANGRIKNVNDYRIAQAWENGFAICKGSKETDNGAALYLDLNEAIDLTAFKTANNAVKYELDIVDPETGAVAMLGNEWCNTHGADLDWIVLKKQLTNEEEVIVPVKVYAVLCNNDKIETGTVNVKFVNPAKVSLSKNIINVKDGTEAYTTEDLKKYITITSSKDSSVELYKDGALTTAGEKILGKSANVSINLAKGSVIPTQWENKFTLNADGTVTWNLEGQNTLAKGQNATCDITFTIEYGKVKPSQVITDCTETSPVLGGGKLTGKFTIKAWNADEFPVE